LLTNKGAVTFCLTHPRHACPKVYHVWVEGVPSRETLQQWHQGVMLAGRQTLPAEVRVLDGRSPNQTRLEIVLREGRNRQIRRVAEQLGHPVQKLHRVAIGSINLGELPRGEYRQLTQPEIEFLQAQVAGMERQMGQRLPAVRTGERVKAEAGSYD
jgi:23S rRNA pseudouridine2605 synthase